MCLQPREIVMVMDFVDNRRAENLRHPLTNPVATGVGVAPSQIHARDIFATEIGVGIENDRVNVDTIFAATSFDVVCGDTVTESARSEVNTDPDAVLLVVEDVNIVVAAADRSKLSCCFSLERVRSRNVPGRVVEQRVIERLVIVSADSEGDRFAHIVHDLRYAGTYIIDV